MTRAHTVDPRTPVLVGVGTATNPGDDPTAAAEVVELMTQAARAAAHDAGAPGLLARVGRVAVPKGMWGYHNPAHVVAQRIGAPAARSVLVELGIPQQTLINDALRAIRAGQLDVALVVGGEALRREALARRAGVTLALTDDRDHDPDEHQVPAAEIVAPAELAVGAVVPVQQYAMIETALRRAEGQPIEAHAHDVAALWSRFSEVAAGNPEAAFPTARSAGFLGSASADNRPLAFPYLKWHATQWTVDQAGALLLCSVQAARDAGVPPEQWLFPHVGLESSFTLTLSCRADLHRWPAMHVLGEAAAARIRRPLAEVEHAEVYSCFPAAVRVQQRELGLPVDGTPTITGGMPFAGGPLNNFVYQATAAMARRLRSRPGELGLVTTVSGLLTKPGLAVWSTDPAPEGELVDDLAITARAETAARECLATYDGPATVATYTVTYDGSEPNRVIAIADTPDGRRCVAACADATTAVSATRQDLIGTPIAVTGNRFTA